MILPEDREANCFLRRGKEIPSTLLVIELLSGLKAQKYPLRLNLIDRATLNIRRSRFRNCKTARTQQGLYRKLRT
ncbi:hypothetical protein X777_16130 [Ooceraea biroi]|uniref:Uncharacterized protein n=1 Tax=Ooceraea biroi TaxID=2015173 RepID=A0A026WV82_OOCBI|nr:hypothetical protein X777_16130 [Ooceraea biroi]